VTGRDPEEPDRVPKEPETDIDAAFAEIVAGWEREHGHTEWPADGADAAGATADPAAEAEPELEDEPAAAAIEEDPAEDELGLMLLVIPGVIGFSAQAGLIFGLLAISGGIVWLIARLRQGPPTDSGWDDGAQL
jgi:hypothetical protein